MWVKQLIKKVQRQENGMETIRYRKGMAKPLMEEALPIGLFSSIYFNASQDIYIQLKIGNQPFDAIVSDQRRDKSPISYIEVTQAHEGESTYLKMKRLHETGSVNSLGEVRKSGTKTTGIVFDVDDNMVSQSEILQKEARLVEDAIKRKLGKQYPSNTLLLIAFNDEMAFDREDNIQNLKKVIDRYLPHMNMFCQVALVGTSKRLLIERTISTVSLLPEVCRRS
jgi:hypothetical protein